jgi:hypothetical protein
LSVTLDAKNATSQVFDSPALGVGVTIAESRSETYTQFFDASTVKAPSTGFGGAVVSSDEQAATARLVAMAAKRETVRAARREGI